MPTAPVSAATAGVQPRARPAQDPVTGSIARASARTGVEFDYLLAQAAVESALDPRAKARTSSASGLFQFTEQTWLGMLSEHGGDHGYGWAADAISGSPGGRYRVADAGLRREIMNLRFDPEASSVMAAEFALKNGAHLESRLGRRPETVDLYLAHFLGAAGATKFLRHWQTDPGAGAAAHFPEAARANRPIFYANGHARSFDAIRSLFERKLADAGGAVPAPAGNSALAYAEPMATPHARFVSTAPGAPAPRGLASTLAADAGRPPQFHMQEFVPMPSRLSLDFARDTYERLAGVGRNG